MQKVVIEKNCFFFKAFIYIAFFYPNLKYRKQRKQLSRIFICEIFFFQLTSTLRFRKTYACYNNDKKKQVYLQGHLTLAIKRALNEVPVLQSTEIFYIEKCCSNFQADMKQL